MQRPVVQQDRVVAVDPLGFRLARMDDEQSHHADRHLHHLVGVRVVHVGAVLLQRERVLVGFAWLDVRLGQATDAVHAGRQVDAMPVDRGVLGQPVGHVDAHAIAFEDLDRRARGAAVVAPALRPRARRELVLDLLGDQMEHLDAIDHPMRQRPAIRRAHFRVPALARRRVTLGQSGGGQRSGQRGGTGVAEEVAAVHSKGSEW